MTERDKLEPGVEYPPGSPEDLQLMIRLLNQFFTSKLRAIELFQKGVRDGGTTTGSTKSVCHIDGKDDGDDGKQPDV
jgi:hypothetical protein